MGEAWTAEDVARVVAAVEGLWELARVCLPWLAVWMGWTFTDAVLARRGLVRV